MSVLYGCRDLMYKIYCDGASRSNPGEASIGVSITKETKEIEFISQKIMFHIFSAFTSVVIDHRLVIET